MALRPMAETLWLSRDELRELTGVRQHTAQERALDRLRIHHERRKIDGSLIVGREAARLALLGMPIVVAGAAPAANEPDDAGIKWSAQG